MRLTAEARNRVRTGGEVVVEIAPSTSENRSWIALIPVRNVANPLDPKSGPEGKFLVRRIELSADLIRDDYHPYDGDLLIDERKWADSIEDAEVIVSRWADPSTLASPWVDDYPF